MTYARFEDLPVWKAAIALAERIFKLVEHRAFNGKGDIRSQLQRAVTSISNNIAEGFERGTTQELLTFLYYARGSAGEVRSMLHLCERLHGIGDNAATRNARHGDETGRGRNTDRLNRDIESEISNLKSEISNLRSACESVSRQLRGWADSLQNSDIKGRRHLNDRERRNYQAKNRADKFWAHLDRVRQGLERA